MDADVGKKAEITFTPTEKGEYAFYCTIEGHRAAGMEASLSLNRQSRIFATQPERRAEIE